MIVLGVTGSFGTGKSTVARLLARRGAVVLDADALAHAAMRPGTPIWRRLRRRFGPGVVRAGGAIDRRALACAGFASARAWRDLCRIIHPAVIAETRRRLAAIRRRRPAAVVVLDVPLLIESGMTRLVDWVVVVAAPQRVSLARLARGPYRRSVRRRVLARARRWPHHLSGRQGRPPEDGPSGRGQVVGWPAAEIRRRLRWPMPLLEKVRRAYVVIDNRGSRRATAVQVRALWQRIQNRR